MRSQQIPGRSGWQIKTVGGEVMAQGTQLMTENGRSLWNIQLMTETGLLRNTQLMTETCHT